MTPPQVNARAPGRNASPHLSGPAAIQFTAGEHDVSVWQGPSGDSIYEVRGRGGVDIGQGRASGHIHLDGGAIYSPFRAPVRSGFAPREVQAGQHIVQLHTQALPAYRDQIEQLGGRVIGYLPDNAYLVLAKGQALEAVQRLPFVRATTPMPSRFKMDEMFRDASTDRPFLDERTGVVVSVAGHQATASVERQLAALGFTDIERGHDTLVAKGTRQQIRQAAGLDDVVWVGPDSVPSDDLDNARIVGGADFLSRNTTSFQGQGQRAHILEGIEAGHPAFAANAFRGAPIAILDGAPDSHGQATAGIVFGNDPSSTHPGAVGIVPHAQPYYTNRNAIFRAAPGSREPGSRYALTKELVEQHNIDAQTASWGHALTTKYDERSRELDGIMEEFDLVVTQSQSNSGTPQSRPQAWAKNVIPVTALYHFDNADFGDDRWNRGSSTRDGGDKRIGRTLSAFYDRTATTALNGRYRLDFGGTSGATPIVNGYMHVILQMYKEGTFRDALLNPDSFQQGQRPRAATAAALAIASARQHPFTGRDADANRYRQGWGFPDVRRLYEARDRLFIVNEDVKLATFENARYSVDVAAGEPELKISMVYKDPPALVPAARAQVNDLDLKVTAPDGTVYFGNFGLLDGIYSQPGGEPDRIDTVENVFVQNPQAGRWTIEVIGQAVNQPLAGDPKVSFALVALGGRQGRP